MAKRVTEKVQWCAWGLLLLFFIAIGAPVLAVHAQTPTPVSGRSGFGNDSRQSGYAGNEDVVIRVLNDYWRGAFSDKGTTYRTPKVRHVTSPMLSGCNSMMYPEEENAFYCKADETVYLFPEFMASVRSDIGDYAPFTIIGHEWGHHIQWLLGEPRTDSKTYELQADCLSGVFMATVEEQNLLDAGDFLEALTLHYDIGDDVLGLPVDNADAHGTGEERVKALVKGYGGGPEKCGVLLGQSTVPVPTPTPWPIPQEPPSLPTPPVVGGPTDPNSPRLPNALPLDHAGCFSIVDGGSLTFSELLDRFSGFSDASARLQRWGWQTSAYRQFGCEGPPEGDAGWIDISVHGFSSASSAQEAADYFASARLDGTSLRRSNGPGIGDYSIALVGPASNGTEFTIYATHGPWLVRVTGVSPSGIPFMNVRAVTIDVLEAQDMGGVSRSPAVPDESSSAPRLPSKAYLPSSPNLNYATCFRTHTRGSYSAREVDEASAATGIGASATATYGWRDGAYIVFMCDDPPFGHARQLDVVIHQFRDSSAADQMRPYVDAFFTAGDHQSRAWETAGALVICVTGYAETGSPLSDVYFVLNQVVAEAGQR